VEQVERLALVRFKELAEAIQYFRQLLQLAVVVVVPEVPTKD
jgi:hypothetical protein